MTFLTIREAAKAVGLPHTCLRTMLANKSLPGFQSGNRYYVNVDLLIAKLDAASRANDTSMTATAS